MHVDRGDVLLGVDDVVDELLEGRSRHGHLVVLQAICLEDLGCLLCKLVYWVYSSFYVLISTYTMAGL